MSDLTGQTFGRWTVLAPAPRKTGNIYFKCQCSCGAVRSVYVSDLRLGKSISCGCWQSEKASLTFKKHGRRFTRLYRIWLAMKNRCSNPTGAQFHLYGGRGIRVCERWKSSFESFLTDMGEPPGNQFSIDRIDNNGNYEPRNCRWATASQQMNNKRNNRWMIIKGERLTMKQAATQFDVRYDKVRARLDRGWTDHQAIGIERRK